MRHYSIITLGVAFTLILGSCSIFNSTQKTITAKPIESVNDSIIQPISEKKPNLPDIEKHISGEWTIISVYNKKIVATDMPFLNFDIDNNRIYGNNGCNVINGNFVVSNKNKELRFSNIISSLMACPDYKFESSIMRAIGEVVNYNLVTIKGIIHLNLLDHRGSTILQLKRHNLHELNGAWSVKEIDDEVIYDENVKLVIDIPELKLHGNSGCNIINGSIALDPNKDFAIQFLQIISTRKACPDMNVEMSLLVALEEVESYKKVNANEIVFYNNKKSAILKLKRLNIKK